MSTLTFPLNNYPTGTRTFVPIALTQGLNGCEIRIARCTTATPTIWTSETQRVTFRFECSYDQGVTYQANQGYASAVGGIEIIRGVELPEKVFRFSSVVPPTHLRGSVTIENGPIRTAMTVTTS